MRIAALYAVISLMLLTPALSAGEHVAEGFVLVTGFVPFDRWEVNPSQLVTEELDGDDVNGIHIIGIVLPVDFNTSFEMVKEALHTYEPSVVIALGLDGSARVMCVENIGVNLKREKGWQLNRIAKEKSFIYFSSLPSRDIVQNLRDAGIPARQSFFAGVYACNFILYRLMDYIQEYHLNITAGFIHLPPLSSQRPYGMELATMVKGVKMALAISMG